MKVNNRRKVFGDAVDLLMDDIEEKTAAGGLRMLSIKKIRPFHDHPFPSVRRRSFGRHGCQCKGAWNF